LFVFGFVFVFWFELLDEAWLLEELCPEEFDDEAGLLSVFGGGGECFLTNIIVWSFSILY
jgi:hypothetical protein